MKTGEGRTPALEPIAADAADVGARPGTNPGTGSYTLHAACHAGQLWT